MTLLVRLLRAYRARLRPIVAHPYPIVPPPCPPRVARVPAWPRHSGRD